MSRKIIQPGCGRWIVIFFQFLWIAIGLTGNSATTRVSWNSSYLDVQLRLPEMYFILCPIPIEFPSCWLNSNSVRCNDQMDRISGLFSNEANEWCNLYYRLNLKFQISNTFELTVVSEIRRRAAVNNSSNAIPTSVQRNFAWR